VSAAAASGRAAQTASAARASVATAVALLLLKLWAALTTGSVAMLASLADTGLDLFASLIILWAVRVAARPADPAHRFGHGKAEALAALAQVALIAASAAGIAARAVDRWQSGAVAAAPATGIGVSLAAIAVTALLLVYQRRVIAATGSVAIGADHVHYQSDLLLNLAVIAALLLEGVFGLRGADPLFGILIALWLVRGAWRAARTAIDQLMDREWPAEKRQRLIDLANAQPLFAGRVHDLRTRTSGVRDFAQFHVWVPPEMTVAAAHRAVDAAEAAIAAAFPGIDLLIHLDPEGQMDRAGRADEALRETPER
jgi:ferrous-iron efflux pump FieF